MEPRILSSQKVKPAISKSYGYLPVSNLDRVISSMYPQQFLAFESASWGLKEDVVTALKRTLAEVLVHYYPLAAELKDPEQGMYKILCNGTGAKLTEAYMDAPIKDLDFTFPGRSFARKFLPEPNLVGPVLCPLYVKITRFRCGGLLLGMCYHHQVADFRSFLMFVQAWSKAMRGQEVRVLPSHNRWLLEGRPHPFPFKNHDLEYRVKPKDEVRVPRLPNPVDENPVLSKYFHLNKRTNRQLRRLATADGNYGPFTSSVCVAAFFWRLIMRANGFSREDQVAKLVCSVDGRQRLLDVGVADNYFGNMIGLACSAINIGKLEKAPLSLTAGLIHENMQRVMTSDHFRSLIDWVEAQKPLTVCPNFDMSSEPVMICSSWINAPFYDLDFGLGRRPHFVGCGSMPAGVYNILWLNPSPYGRGNILAEVHLRSDSLSRLENDPEFEPILSSHREFMSEYRPSSKLHSRI
ncbi:hypothetical protein R1sor_020550 [Riccia sorocarpa]|uniref:Transferase n=1 Tax=Riccia sorocarpa TaxID=122646 RepID=A0ABD3IFS2_9MARC